MLTDSFFFFPASSQSGKFIGGTIYRRNRDAFSSAESMARAMAWTRMNWQRLFSYAEVICFVTAWAVSLLLAFSAQRSVDDHLAARNFAATTDVLGIQATRSR
jgi:hypothetical protein